MMSDLKYRIEISGRIQIQGILDNRNISGLSIWNEHAIIVTDESDQEQGNVAQIFEFVGDELRPLPGGVIALDASPAKKKIKEMDLEGVAVHGNTVYVLGSHSARRKKTDPTSDYKSNRATLISAAEAQPNRDVLLSFRLNAAGQPGKVNRSSLKRLLAQQPFKSFRKIASKENGIDAEGLAFFDGHLYVGFRGPVLRDNFVPILRLPASMKTTAVQLLFVQLGGRGIRELAHTDKGLLILAGPVGDGSGSYQLYHWDGHDTVPGKKRPKTNPIGELTLLGDLPLPTTTDGTQPKAEGLAMLNADDAKGRWDVLVVFDGLPNEAIRYHIEKVGSK